jgi:hypothetical protein
MLSLQYPHGCDSPEYSLTALFCSIDDFCQAHLPLLREKAMPPRKGKRRRTRSLSESEIMTILIAFHQSHYRNFKAFYLGYVCQSWRAAFPGLVSYNRFVEFIPSVLVLLFEYLKSLFGKCSGISFIDSTALGVCHNRRIRQHKVFRDSAERGKTSLGWFFGFKLHLVISDSGELLNMTLTKGNTDDRKPVPDLLRSIFGKVFGDKGYISKKLQEALRVQNVDLITKPRKNMKTEKVQPLSSADQWLLQKRSLIETVIDQLKNISQIEHSRHRAGSGFLWNLATALIAYCHQPKKPTLRLPNQIPSIVS